MKASFLLFALSGCERTPAHAPAAPLSSDSALSVLVDGAGTCTWRFQDPLRGIDEELALFPCACFETNLRWRFDGGEAVAWIERPPDGASDADPILGSSFVAPAGVADVWIVDLQARTMRAVPAPPGAPRFLSYDRRGDLLAVYYAQVSPGTLAAFFGPWFGNSPDPHHEVQLRRWTGRRWRSSNGGFKVERARAQLEEFAARLSPGPDAWAGVDLVRHTGPSPAPSPGTEWARFRLESDPSRAVVTKQDFWIHGASHSPPAYFVDAGGIIPVALSGTDGGISVSSRGDLVLIHRRSQTGPEEWRRGRFTELENLLFRFGLPAPIATIGSGGAFATFWPVTDAAVVSDRP